jgi:putative membrane protein
LDAVVPKSGSTGAESTERADPGVNLSSNRKVVVSSLDHDTNVERMDGDHLRTMGLLSAVAVSPVASAIEPVGHPLSTGLVPAVRPSVVPKRAVLLTAYALAGVALGACSGLTPGLHANNLALGLAAVAADLPGPPVAVAGAMLAAGVVHTFLDAVPALALGVPDAAMAAGALPGHELVLAGRGREAVRLSAVGSGLAVALAVPLAVPVTAVVVGNHARITAWLPVVLAGVVVFLLATESSPTGAVGGAVAFLASAGLGSVALSVDPTGPLPIGGPLTPLFAGLFGAPVLLDALDGGGVPPQGDAAIRPPPWVVATTAAGGAGAGGLVGYLPGVSAAVAAAVALPLAPDDGPRSFVVASSGANTANAVFALFALAALGTPRTGVTVAVDSVGAGDRLVILLAVALVAAAAGVTLVVTVGDAYLRTVGRLPQRPLVGVVLALLVVLSVLFAGPIGLVVLGVATGLGLLPPRVGCRRVHLMGVLLGPILLRRLPHLYLPTWV